VIERLEKIFHGDWEKSKPLDLSDEGLISELKDSDNDIAEELAIHFRPKSVGGDEK
jgi:cardiolipin synthase A/B